MEHVVPLPAPGSSAARAEVVIIGAGPTGLMLGVLLRQAGVNVIIIDPHEFSGQGSKAALTMPRSWELLEYAGVGTALQALGRPVLKARICLGGDNWEAEISGLDDPGVQTRYCPWTVGQNFLEEALNDRFLKLGGRLYRAARFTSYAETPDGIEVNVDRWAYVRPPAILPPMPNHLCTVPKTTLKAAYLIGCDGKQSAVRDAMGASYVGHDYPTPFLVADVEVPFAEVERSGYGDHVMHTILDSSSGSVVHLARLHKTKWRTYFCRRGLTRTHLTPEFITEQWQKHCPAPGPFVPTEFKDLAFIEVACKLASTFRKGRCFLVGDAAHCHSPAGGQGMNTGLQDSANLAWKLAAVLKGQAGDKLLDSYELERRPIAEWVFFATDGLFQGITSQTSVTWNVARRFLIQAVLGILPKNWVPPRFFLDKAFGLSLSYADSGTCRNTGAAPRRGMLCAGDRLPDIACEAADAAHDVPVYTLSLLASPPRAALRLLLIAETSGGRPSQAELEAALAAFRPLLAIGVLFQPVLYTSNMPPAAPSCDIFAASHVDGTQQPSQSLAPPVDADALAGFAPLRVLAPVAPGAGEKRVFAELCAGLGLDMGGKALLVVRPDGYIAVAHVGSWDAQPAAAAIQELGVGRT